MPRFRIVHGVVGDEFGTVDVALGIRDRKDKDDDIDDFLECAQRVLRMP